MAADSPPGCLSADKMRSYRKNIFRTIKSTVGRYLALVLITALGVMIYVGLSVSTDDMLKTADEYYAEDNFYDYYMVSTIGFSDASVETAAEDESVLLAEGAYYEDAITDVGETSETGELSGEVVIRYHSLTYDINTVDLLYGSLPSSEDECVVDSKYFDESAIGRTITITDTNTDETLEAFSVKTFTITGIVTSPLYLNYNRGTTSAGNGSISCFAYILYDSFEVEYYSQIFVDIEDGYTIYSDEYNDLIDDTTDHFEDLTEAAALVRYNELRDEAIDEAYEEAEEEIEEAVQEIEDARDEFQEAYDEQVRELEEELSAMPEMLAVYRAELEDTYDAQMEEFDSLLDEIPEIDMEEIEVAVDDEMPDYTTVLLTRDENEGYVTFEDNAQIVRSISYIFPLFFALVAALVCITTMSRMIEEERTQIGVFKALGYSKTSVFIKYILYSVSAGVIGSVLGWIIGCTLFPTVIWAAYQTMYYFAAAVVYIFPAALGIACLAVSVALLLLTTVFTCMRVMSAPPAEMIRPKAPEPGKRVLLERIRPLWKRLSFMNKVTLRNCFRYKKRLFMMLIGVAGCTALLITGFGISDSVTDVCDVQYDEISVYDYSLSLETDDDETAEDVQERTEELYDKLSEYLEDVYLFTLESLTVMSDDVSREVTVYSVDSLESLDIFMNFEQDGEPVETPDEYSCVVSANLSDMYDVRAGDTLTVIFEDYSEAEYIVSAVYDNFVGNYLYITYEGRARGTDGTAQVNYGIGNVKEGLDIYEALADMQNLDGVTSVTATEVTVDYFENMVSRLNVIVLLVIACAAALAIVVMYNLSNINILERQREIATLKVLGFYKGETSAYIFKENTILTLIGAIVGIPLGYLMHYLVMCEVKIESIAFDIHINWLSIVISVVITLIFDLIVDMVMRRKIRRINMAESLKSAE